MIALFISTLVLGLGIGLLGGIHIGFNSCLEWKKEMFSELKGDK